LNQIRIIIDKIEKEVMIELNEKDITNNFNLISIYKMLDERKIVNLYDW
jgi:hypothetical protein